MKFSFAFWVLVTLLVGVAIGLGGFAAYPICPLPTPQKDKSVISIDVDKRCTVKSKLLAGEILTIEYFCPSAGTPSDYKLHELGN